MRSLRFRSACLAWAIVVACLADPQQDLRHLYPCAHEILHWYFDQGSKEVPLHAELSALALDIARSAEVRE